MTQQMTFVVIDPLRVKRSIILKVAEDKSDKFIIGPVQRKFAIIFLSFSLNMCFGCSKEPSH